MDALRIPPRARRVVAVRRARDFLVAAGFAVMALWTGSIVRALDQDMALASKASVSRVLGVVYLLFAYTMWLLTLVAVLLQVMRPGSLADLVLTLALLMTSGVVWLILKAGEDDFFFSGGVGAWTWRSLGFCFGTLIFLRVLVVVA